MNDDNADSTMVDEDVAALGAETSEEHQPLEQDAEGQGPDAQNEASAQDQKLAREAAKWRKRTRDLEAQLKAREDAELSEQERSMRRLAELEKELESREASLRDSRLRASIATEAARLGIVGVAQDDVARLLDTSSLDYDLETGYSGVPEAIRELMQERPWLTAGASSGSEASPGNPARKRSRLTAAQLKSMSDAEIAALPWDDVTAALAES